MKSIYRLVALSAAALLFANVSVAADPYSSTVRLFKNAGESNAFFGSSHGYAIFPSIGKGGLGIGGAYGKGRVYDRGKLIGDVSMTQVSLGFQAGGQAYSEIIFFENKAALSEFTEGNFEFGGDIGAIAITASANASASTSGGPSAGASGSKKEAVTTGSYHKGVAVFTIAKGGLMYEAAVQGQKFSYKKRGAK